MSNFWIYLVGVVLVTAALAYGAFTLGLAPVWIGVGVVVFLGFGLMGAAKKAGMNHKAGSVSAEDDTTGQPRR